VRLALVLRVAFLFAFFSLATPAVAGRTLMVFGDSLSAAYGLSPAEGWVSLLGLRVEKSRLAWNVANASISGETTAGGVSRISEDLKRHKPSIVVIELGANDALRGQPIAAIRANLEKMIRIVRDAHAEPVLVGLMIPPNYGIDYAREFREVFASVAKKEKVKIVPFLLEGFSERQELFQADQLHPTAAAQPAILDNVWRVIEPLLAKKP
jgi:acyl-CoA thioesterase-1